MVDKYHFVKGGAERYLFQLSSMLEDGGHEVVHFSMQDKRNLPSAYDDYFVSNIDYGMGFFKSPVKTVRAAMKMFYSFEAKSKLEKLINYAKPDIAHLHMIDHQLSPSILSVFKKYKIPVLQTVHQYKLVCPNYKLYNPRTNEICEKCLPKKRYFHAFTSRCHKDSFNASLLISLESYFQRFFKVYQRNIDAFLVPSKFMGNKLIQGGIDPQKIHHLFYSIDVNKYMFNPNFNDYIVYFGRLSKEKGIVTLLRAMDSLRTLKLKIIGEGPEETHIKEYVTKHDLVNVELVGKLQGEKLTNAISNSMFVVVPSEWYDNSPLVIYEAFAMGKPVVGSRAGGIPELVEDGKNGYLFEMGNVTELVKAISTLVQQPFKIKAFGLAGRKRAEELFSPEKHYPLIMSFYRKLVNTQAV